MAVPDYQSIMLPLLEYAGDGELHTFREAIIALAEFFELSGEELEELLPSGVQTVFHNRVSWANTYLKKAGLLDAPARGHLRITERGLDVLDNPPERITNRYLSQFSEFVEFKERRSDGTQEETENDEDESLPYSTPQEAIETSYRKIRGEIETELLESVSSASPTFFEQLVIELLIKMGYGGSQLERGRTIGRSHDGGIDGVINEDRLGLDVVYIQAKRWEGTVGRPEIQKFAGALQGRRARKGVFISTSSFSREAHEYVSMIDSKIVLIDGEQLAQLMFDHNVGVSTVKAYEIKQIDSDYFDGPI